MEKHIVKILKTEFVTHNVKRFTLEKPEGYTFISGQATDVSINKPGLENELRPFTFTCLNEDDHLEFTIKIYKDHNGVTSKLADLNAGDELIIHEVFGAIEYKETGLFIAGGAGITPFISILKKLRKQDLLQGNVLLFANRAAEDIILKDELDEMLGENHIDILSEPGNGKEGRRIDEDFLKPYINEQMKSYYICGPDEFVEAIKKDLAELGVNEKQMVFEQ